jgi:hypothetical protein
MPINTDLNVSPYFDDYNEKDDYYKILFKPGVAVQVRELNQLQTILQKQIERFGDNMYKRGTIIDGCNFLFHNPLPYVKINDLETDGTPVNVSAFKGYLVKNSANLVAQVVETASGFEATAPDLNTMFVKYLNHGTSGNNTSFGVNQVLTVYDPTLAISDVDINVKSSGFSNTDVPVFLSAITVQNSTGGQSFVNATGQACTFSVGEVITQDYTGARAEIRQVNATANLSSLILKIRPLASELRIGNTDSWTFLSGYQFTSSSSKITANLSSLIGTGAKGSIITDTNGGITTLIVTGGGKGYYVEPYVTARYNLANTSPSANAIIDALNITAKNYAAKVTVNSAAAAIGNGYGFSVSDGIIYQKGYFSRVGENFVVVEKYSTSTNNVVGFDTLEEVIDYKTDQRLYDNATGTFNINAPGANRLKLTPVLTVLTKDEAEANDTFFSIVEFSEGKPFKQNKVTQFNTIGTKMARRTAEESGDFVIDQFIVSTSGQETFADEATQFEIAIDPGLAYIDGYRVETNTNYYKDIRKGTNTEIIPNTAVSINYGNYIQVKELGGLFKFSVGATISLRDTAASYLTVSSTVSATQFTTPAPAASNKEIGTARIRSLALVSGSAGEPGAVYYMYLFDIRMNTGKNFKDVRSVYYNGSGSNDGIADIVLTGEGATIYDPKNSSLLYYSGATALKNANNLSYTYRTVDDTVSCAITGQMSVSVAANPGEFFPYNATLSDAQKLSIIAVPLANAICTNAVGSVTTGATSITGSGTVFLTAFQTGDYVRVANTTAVEIRRITAIASNTSMTVSTGNSYPAGANIGLVFPQYAPIPLYLRNNRTVTVSGNTTLVISLGNTISTTVGMAVSYNAQRTVNAVPKSITRQAYVKINTASNVDTNKGPWCLGIPDIVRLKNVYLGNSSAVTTSDTNVTSNFWIDHNQKKDYYDVGFLYRKPEYSVSSSVYLLAEFDVLSTTQQGLKTLASYPVDDTLLLANSTTTINTVEIPEMYNDNGEYIDLRDYFDFRPYSTNTAILTTTASSATVNPIEPTQTNRFDTTYDKKFPVPQSDCTTTLEKYLGRKDAIVLSSNGDFRVIEGTSSKNPKAPDIPSDGLLINYLIIPPYPSLPKVNSANTAAFLNKRISNIKYTTKRQTDYKVTVPIDEQGLAFSQPKRYTMKEIGALERRIADLEYYTTLSATEDTVNSLELTSSTDTTTNRFKFGFFVDNFTTVNFAELNDPTYNAQIYGYELHPAKRQVQIKYRINEKDSETTSCLNGEKILLPSTRKRLIGQGLATEATTVEVSVTETISTTTGTQINSSTTTVKEITTTDYELLTGSKKVASGTKIVAETNTTGLFPTHEANNGAAPPGGALAPTWVRNFEVGKLAGTITAYGNNEAGKVHLPVLERYVNGVWEIVAGSSDGSGNGITRTSNKGWKLTYSYTPNASASNRQFRLIQKQYSQKSSLSGGTFPTSKDVITYNNVATYAVDTQTSKQTKTEIIPSSTIVENTTSITKPLFNSRLTGMMTIDNLFNPPSKLSSPFIDLAATIQNDINS